VLPPRGLDGTWEELNDEKAIHKACQVMRDIDRPDRKDREVRRRKKLKLGPDGEECSVTSDAAAKEDAAVPAAVPAADTPAIPAADTTTEVEAAISAAAEKIAAAAGPSDEANRAEIKEEDIKKDPAETSTTAEKAVEDAVAAVEEGLDKAMEEVTDKAKPALEDTGTVMV
jgi:hypothetical protein